MFYLICHTMDGFTRKIYVCNLPTQIKHKTALKLLYLTIEYAINIIKNIGTGRTRMWTLPDNTHRCLYNLTTYLFGISLLIIMVKMLSFY